MTILYKSVFKLASLVLLLLLIHLMGCTPPKTAKVGVVLLDNSKHLLYGIEKSNENVKVSLVGREDFSANCGEAAKKVTVHIKQSVDLLLLAKDDNCLSDIQKVADSLHFSWSYIVEIKQDDVEKITAKLKQVSDQIATHDQIALNEMYSVIVPLAVLRKQPPAKPGEPNSSESPFLLKSGDSVEHLKPQIKSKGDSTNPTDYRCKRDPDKDLIYDGIYLQDWMCVKSISDPNKVGWIHKMLVKKR